MLWERFLTFYLEFGLGVWSLHLTFHCLLSTPFLSGAYFDLRTKICFKKVESYCIKISLVIMNKLAGISYLSLSPVAIISEKRKP